MSPRHSTSSRVMPCCGLAVRGRFAGGLGYILDSTKDFVFPAGLREIDARFMTAVLRRSGVIDSSNEVVSLEESGVGMTAGYFSDIKRMRCAYHATLESPSSLLRARPSSGGVSTFGLTRAAPRHSDHPDAFRDPTRVRARRSMAIVSTRQARALGRLGGKASAADRKGNSEWGRRAQRQRAAAAMHLAYPGLSRLWAINAARMRCRLPILPVPNVPLSDRRAWHRARPRGPARLRQDDRPREPPHGRLPPARTAARSRARSRRCSRRFPGCASATASAPEACPAASSRCSPSAAR